MSDTEEDVIIPIGIGLAAYFLVLKPVLKEFGIDPEAQAAVTDVDNTQPTDNPFNMNFAGGSIAKGGFQYPATFTSLKSRYNSHDPTLLANEQNFVQLCEQVHDAFAAFPNPTFGANFQAVLSVFNSLADQGIVSDMDAYMQANYQLSLWSLLKNGFPFLPFLPFTNGLSTNQLAQIVTIVNALPQ